MTVIEDAEIGDYFGYSLESGDFNGDQCDDLAVGIPWEDIDGISNSGAVQIFYGTMGGLMMSINLSELIHQDSPGVPDVVEESDWFGYALDSGDYNGDGFDDLAVGVPWEDLGELEKAGAVNVFFGSDVNPPGPVGFLTSTAGVMLTASTIECPFETQAQARFGTSLASGSSFVEGGGVQFIRDFLAVGSPRMDVSGQVGAGVVFVIQNPASPSSPSWVYSQASPGTPGEPQEEDQFGRSLAVGNLSGGVQVELAIGIPLDDIDGVADAGSVLIRPFTPDGMQTLITREDLSDVSEEEDNFGYTLLAANFNAHGADDLVIGSPYRDVEGHLGLPRVDAGDAWVIYGKAGSGLDLEDSVRIQSPSEGGHFSLSLTAGRFWGGSRTGLVVGVPNKDRGGFDGTGEVRVFKSGLFVDGFETGDLSRWSDAME